ncbi:MAG TPA: hypothetical protein VOA64_13315 [Candidatus Dormibacteraeota bacterium]|nr:hypothetical protein [Candidatus Dormibacteraeota bacterium]
MLNRYKEIFYGLLLGSGAWVIDAMMHAQEEGGSFWGEVVHVHGGTLFYRLFFIAFGLALGWSLWTRSRREREFRRLAEIYERFHREVVQPAFLIHAKCEELLLLDDSLLPAKAREAVRFIYDKVRSIESLSKERLSIPGETP